MVQRDCWGDGLWGEAQIRGKDNGPLKLLWQWGCETVNSGSGAGGPEKEGSSEILYKNELVLCSLLESAEMSVTKCVWSSPAHQVTPAEDMNEETSNAVQCSPMQSSSDAVYLESVSTPQVRGSVPEAAHT